MTRDSMVFYRSFAEGIADLDEKDQLEAFWNIVRYALDGIEPESAGPARGVFRMARPQIDANNVRYQNGTKGGRPRTKAEPNKNQTETKAEPNNNLAKTKPKPNENVNDNENVLKENTLKGVKEKRFAPPTLENVMGYCQEMGYSIDAQRFIDFYEAKGWYIGKNKMKDWRAAVRNWNRSQRQGLTAEAGKRQGMAAAPNRFHNFEQSETSYDAIMQEQLRRRLTEGENDG